MASENFQILREKAQKELKGAHSLQELEQAYKDYLGRKGELTLILRTLERLSIQERKEQGRMANDLRNTLQKAFENQKSVLMQKHARTSETQTWIDVTAPGEKIQRGHLHPLTQLQRRVQDIFSGMGFGVVEGPEVETEWYNFDALNIPPDHPARDMWDTFWLRQNESKEQNEKRKKDRLILRTHTSPVQIRYMEKHKPPFSIIVPGRVYRYEATDARHEFDLMQLEGLVVGKRISVANFKATIGEFYSQLFRKKMNIRLRPSFFPFVEPGFEVDMTCAVCAGKGCSSCGHGGWMEMMGTGMVHPEVFKNVGYKPREWQGFAFGMGLERLAMMLYKISDIRLFRLGDLKFLHQF